MLQLVLVTNEQYLNVTENTSTIRLCHDFLNRLRTGGLCVCVRVCVCVHTSVRLSVRLSVCLFAKARRRTIWRKPLTANRLSTKTSPNRQNLSYNTYIDRKLGLGVCVCVRVRVVYMLVCAFLRCVYMRVCVCMCVVYMFVCVYVRCVRVCARARACL